MLLEMHEIVQNPISMQMVKLCWRLFVYAECCQKQMKYKTFQSHSGE